MFISWVIFCWTAVLCTPGICKLRNKITVLSGPFVITLRDSPRAWQNWFQCLFSNTHIYIYIYLNRWIHYILWWQEFSSYVKSRDYICVRQKANKPNFPLGNAINVFAQQVLKSTPCSIQTNKIHGPAWRSRDHSLVLCWEGVFYPGCIITPANLTIKNSWKLNSTVQNDEQFSLVWA